MKENKQGNSLKIKGSFPGFNSQNSCIKFYLRLYNGVIKPYKCQILCNYTVLAC